MKKTTKIIVKVLAITIIASFILTGCFITKSSKKENQVKFNFSEAYAQIDITNKPETWSRKLLFADYETMQKKVADINQDGIINEADYGALYNFLMKCTDGIAKRNDNLLAGDVDFDGKIDMVDVYIIKSFCDAPAE